jgi:hypothetical protein
LSKKQPLLFKGKAREMLSSKTLLLSPKTRSQRESTISKLRIIGPRCSWAQIWLLLSVKTIKSSSTVLHISLWMPKKIKSQASYTYNFNSPTHRSFTISNSSAQFKGMNRVKLNVCRLMPLNS